MERSIISLLLIGLCGAAAGQNLVPNGSFEEYTQCPEFVGFAQYATGWLNLHTNSADYFNRCQANIVAGVPFNTLGYQEPADGNAYVGLATTFPGLDWYREIVGVELAEPLQAGNPVCLSFKMAVGGFGSWDGGSAIFTAKGLGLRFFNQYPTDWSTYLYPNSAALHMALVPTDTALWYTVSGQYTPDSNYTHLAIGNFFADSLSEITDLDTSGFGAAGISYAFIDDVRVSYDLQYCGSTGTHEQLVVHGVVVYPNPCVDHCIVRLPRASSGLTQWVLLDLWGDEVLSGSIDSGSVRFEISTAQLTQGQYILRVHDKHGAYAPVRLVSVST